MLYDYIVIDSANLFYRCLGKNETAEQVVRKMISFTEDLRQSLNDILYIIFDPISEYDLGESKSFKFPSSERKKIDENYKANRQYSSLYYQSILLYKKFYTYRGDKVKTIYSQEYEADDFVEPLLEMIGPNKKVALITTDYDWSRYISDNVHMINKGLDKPYSIKEFEEKFLFKPTKASIILYKALYGDSSDNIKGAIYLDKTKLVNNIKELCYNYIKEIADKDKTIEEVISDLDLGRDFDVGNMGETPLEKLLFAFAMNSKQVNIIDRVKLNISIIRSMLEKKDISKYIHSNQEKPEYNSILRQSIFKVDTKTWFGKTK
ncbi:MAG: hypothetical protein IKK93_07055 [Campylobacter sp.]|nr:hypothetical protein [Campylobacter sp.]